MYSITDPNLPELPSKLFHNLNVIQPLKGDDNQIPLFDDMEIKNKATSRSKSNEIFNEEINTSSLNKFNNIILENEIPMNNEEPMKIIEKKYKLKSNSNDIIKIPENYSTDDEDEYKLVSILNEPLDDNWKLAIDDKKNNIKVYKK